MHPMFVELFIRPDDDDQADDRRRIRRARRSRQRRTICATRGTHAASRTAPDPPKAA